MDIVSLASVLTDLTLPKNATLKEKMEYTEIITSELRILKNNECDNLLDILEILIVQ